MITTSLATSAARHWRYGMWSLFVGLLLAPLVAMQFTGEIRWTTSDFAAAGTLLGMLGISVELLARSAFQPMMRAAMIATAVGLAAMVWAQGAVGLLR